jgi:hypothetical protein
VRTPILALALFIPAVAAAEPSYYGDDYDPYAHQEHALHLMGEGGFEVGSFSVGRIAGTAVGFHLDAGVHWNKLALLGGYELLSLTQDADVPEPVRGLIHRLDARARYSIGDKSLRPFRGEFWLELGGGREIIRWYDGGKLSRNDLSFAIGAQGSIRFGANKRRNMGLYYAAKFIIADRPDGKIMTPGCAGPCDEPTAMIPIDLGIFFDVGIPFE